MIAVRQIVPEADAGASVTNTADGLSAFLDPSCAAAIWNRQTEPSFRSWIDALDPATLTHGRCVIHRTHVRSAVTELCNIANTPLGAERDHLIDDITALSEIFAQLMKVAYMRVRLEAVTTNACRKFHIDAIAARLVCTYRGAGTQFGLSHGGAEPESVTATPTGAPILLRGTLWYQQSASILLHRSPPIEGTGETRLVLVLDPVFDLEDAV